MTSTPTPLNVGLIGYGFMGAAHSHGWRTAHRFFDLPASPVLHTIAGRTESAVADAAEQYGFAQHTTRWQDLIEDPEIDVIDICTPGDTHHAAHSLLFPGSSHPTCVIYVNSSKSTKSSVSFKKFC